MVSHSVAEEPTSWKHCCAIFRYSCDCCCCPTAAYTTPAEGGRSEGRVGYAGERNRLSATLKLYCTRSAAPAEGLVMGSWQHTCKQTAMLTTSTLQSSLGPTQNKRGACVSALATSWAFNREAHKITSEFQVRDRIANTTRKTQSGCWPPFGLCDDKPVPCNALLGSQPTLWVRAPMATHS